MDISLRAHLFVEEYGSHTSEALLHTAFSRGRGGVNSVHCCLTWQNVTDKEESFDDTELPCGGTCRNNVVFADAVVTVCQTATNCGMIASTAIPG
jgi:hypothetical protein